MRKLALSLLLATTAVTPAFAQSSNRDDRAAARQEHQAERADARQARSDAREARQADRAEARQQRFDAQAQAQPRPERADRAQRFDSPQRDFTPDRPARVDRGPNVNERGRPTLDDRQQMRDSIAEQRQIRDDRRNQAQDWRDHSVNNADRGPRQTPPVGARPDRPAPPPETARPSPAPQWRTDWRRDNRYDWHNYRNHHRSIFRLGFYFDPFGWGYQRYGIGWRLWPSYYSSSYWLDDPYMYRLPYAPWPYKWVRYYDDALLVDVYSGQVVDVMYDFFW
jgi:hypothetical protein